MVLCSVVFFFFKQKTAYEMRISDWSSDVCSSDLAWIFRSASRGPSRPLGLKIWASTCCPTAAPIAAPTGPPTIPPTTVSTTVALAVFLLKPPPAPRPDRLSRAAPPPPGASPHGAHVKSRPAHERQSVGEARRIAVAVVYGGGRF